MFDKKQFVQNIKRFRQEKGLKQKDVYEAMNCSQAAYSNYENENSPRLPSIENLWNLSKKYDISIDELLGLDTSKNESMADVLNAICNIFKEVHFRIEEIDVPVDVTYHQAPFSPEDDCERLSTQKRHAIYFDSMNYEQALKEMGAILSLRKNWTTMNNMLELWQKNLPTQYEKHPANDACIDFFLPFIN